MTAAETCPCPPCRGTGTLRIVLADPDLPINPLNDATVDVDCNLCHGTGVLRYKPRCGLRSREDVLRSCDSSVGHGGLCRDRRGQVIFDAVPAPVEGAA